jgi:hypothetical protein
MQGVADWCDEISLDNRSDDVATLLKAWPWEDACPDVGANAGFSAMQCLRVARTVKSRKRAGKRGKKKQNV